MAKLITEADIEEMALGWFESLGYQVAHDPEIAPDGDRPERARFRDRGVGPGHVRGARCTAGAPELTPMVWCADGTGLSCARP
ncbi:MAG: hypothetical protein GX134_14625 [candidate division WS1 bacterium]|jgi:hypothetical protein|nr:hypothetical protein [candidate division WS1 bacterium]